MKTNDKSSTPVFGNSGLPGVGGAWGGVTFWTESLEVTVITPFLTSFLSVFLNFFQYDKENELELTPSSLIKMLI